MLSKIRATIGRSLKLLNYNLINLFQDPEGLILNAMRNQFVFDRIKVDVEGYEGLESFHLYVFGEDVDTELTDEEKYDLLKKTFKEELGIELTFR